MRKRMLMIALVAVVTAIGLAAFAKPSASALNITWGALKNLYRDPPTDPTDGGGTPTNTNVPTNTNMEPTPPKE